VIAQPIPHDGPLQADPAAHHCGLIIDYETCSLEVTLTNTSGDMLVIDAVRQDFSPTATTGLIEIRTGFDRDLPYDMSGGEALGLLFDYRRRDPDEVVGGAVVVRYHLGDTSYELEIPISAENP
jgi:hypothetical protein